MDKYNIVYTNAAANDIAEKFQYITSVLHDRTTAERWYARLKDAIWHDLSFMPEKYPLYNEEPLHSKVFACSSHGRMLWFTPQIKLHKPSTSGMSSQQAAI